MDQIAREFQVSPVPVREAVRRLEAEGLVIFTPNVGAQVAGIDTDEYVATMQTLAYLEAAATSLAVPHITDEHLAEARAINDQMRDLSGHGFDPLRFTELNHRFHTVLCGACPNARLLKLLHREWEWMAMIRRSTFSYVPSRSAISVTEHDEIIDSISSGASLDQVEALCRAHKLHTMNEFVAARQTSAGP